MVDGRRRPETISARVSSSDKLPVGAAAAAEGLPVSEYIYRVVVSKARERLAAEGGELVASEDGVIAAEPR